MAECESIESQRIDNARSLKTLARAIAFSQGEFSLVFVRCNYARLRERMLQQLHAEILPEEITNVLQLKLSPATRNLSSTIDTILEKERPSALIVLGLEYVTAIDELLIAANFARDRFGKQLQCPLIFWTDDRILKKLRRIAPDLTSFAAAPIEFEMTSQELRDLIHQQADALFAGLLDRQAARVDVSSTYGRWLNEQYRRELDAAVSELACRNVKLESELDASLQFVLAQDDFFNNRIDEAIARYRQSLRFWRHSDHLERQGIVLFYLGLSLCHKAEETSREDRQQWEDAWIYLNQCVRVFERAERHDLVAQIIHQVGNVLEQLEAWDTLSEVVAKSLQLHQTYGCQLQLALDYGWSARMHAKESRWERASQLVRSALSIFAEIPLETTIPRSLHPQPHGFYRLLWEQIFRLVLVASQRQLGEFQAARENLEIAREQLKFALEASLGGYHPHRYLCLLKVLRSLYFESGLYREAFSIKQEQRSIEQQYGFRPFIGAGQLLPKQRTINPVLESELDRLTPSFLGSVSEAIAVSNRQYDVNRLIARISRHDYKLTVIHGPSGVGKSSLVNAGLVPALHSTPIGDRIALPVVVRVYRDWVRVLGRNLARSLANCRVSEAGSDLDTREFNQQTTRPHSTIPNWRSASAILEGLRKNEDDNLLTILIFDQFEEFFFVCSDIQARQEFYQFLQACLNTSGVKVILSIREDYLHHLLEVENFIDLSEINSNVLDKRTRYSVGNFSKKEACKVIEELTKQAHFYLEDALVRELVEDLAIELGEVRPIELQIVGFQLQTENITTLAKYHQSGPKQKLVERFLEEAIEDCGKENSLLARRVLYLLTEENGTRPLKTRSELVADLASDRHLDLILEILCASGLVFLIPEFPARRYQLVHDYLVEFIRNREQVSIAEERNELRLENEENQRKIEKLSKDVELISEVANARYKVLKYDLETLIPHQEKSNSLAELSIARKRQELSHVAIEQLHQEKELLAALAEAKEKRQESERQQKRFVSGAIAILVAGVLSLTVSTTVAVDRQREAVISEIIALSKSSEGLFALGREIDSLIDGLKSGTKLKQTNWADSKTREQVVMALKQAVYEIRERNRWPAHRDAVISVSFNPKREIIASASADNKIRLWREDGRLIKTIDAHGDRASSLSFSPDGELMASASWDKTIKLWNSNGSFSGIELKGHEDKVLFVTFSPDGTLIASASADKTVKVWNRDGSLLTTLEGHTAPITSVSFSPDSRAIASASADKTIKLWQRNETGFYETTAFNGQQPHNETIASIKFSPDGQLIASASVDKTIKLWNVNGQLLNTLKGHDDSIFHVTFSPDGQTLVSASRDKTIKLWNRDGRLLETLKGHDDWVFSANFKNDGKTLVSGSRDKTIRLWSLDNPLRRSWKENSSSVNAVAWHPNGQFIASAKADNRIQVRSTDGTSVYSLKGHTGEVWGVSFSPGGRLIASASADRTVKLWQRNGTVLRTLSGHRGVVLGVSFSPRGQLIASASWDKTVKLWRRDGTLLRTLQGHEGPVNWVSFSPDSRLIASASEDKTVKLWRRDGTLLRTLTGHGDGVWGVSFSPDSQLVASASIDNTVKLWNRDGTLLHTLEHGNRVTSVSFSEDNRTIASGSSDNTIKLWNRDGKLLHVLNGHRDGITSLSFSADGQKLASASADGTVILWNLADLSLENLLQRGCKWLGDYLENNPNVEPGDRDLCQS